MALNHIQPGKAMAWANGTGSDVSSGDAVLVEDKVFIALGDIADGENGQLGTCEVWEVPKEAPLVIAQGELLYWNEAGSQFTTTSTANTLAGFAFAAAASADTTVLIKLNG